ncbi:hypothetical protein DXA36_00370 [Eisenbergiella sp. OF01-20]|nr:hypothetical protein DXA36_00370 [Eisenbergiella sp. OF01-20]
MLPLFVIVPAAARKRYAGLADGFLSWIPVFPLKFLYSYIILRYKAESYAQVQYNRGFPAEKPDTIAEGPASTGPSLFCLYYN